MKRIILSSVLVLAILSSVIFCAYSNTVTDKEEDDDKDFLGVSFSNADEKIDEAVSKAILEYNGSRYLEGECAAEGHIIYGVKNDKDTVNVYALMSYSWYGFVNDCFIDVSGCGSVPCVIHLKKQGDDYILDHIDEPEDGAHYIKSVKKLFPKIYEHRALNFTEKDSDKIYEQLQAYAKAYLEEIGREAKICSYCDIDTQLPNISAELSNELVIVNKEKLQNYPYWIGTQEKIEDGKRMVYKLDFDESKKEVTYTKYEYSSPDKILETYTFIDIVQD